jgi:enamine deaminase RidA (YjgF/YER057c/UK114 family)
MVKILWVVALLLLFFQASANAQSLEVKMLQLRRMDQGRFIEVVTVTGPDKMIFLANVGAEDEEKPQGNICHLGNPHLQCKYAYDKMKRLLAKHGATLADVVQQVTDIRYQADVGKCRREEYGEAGPIPANTFLVISGLAIQGMLLEIDINAVVK